MNGKKQTVVSSEALLTVADLPKITQHPDHQSAFIGADIEFTVEANGDNLEFQWQKDGQNIDSTQSRFQCNQTDKTSTLHIKRVKKSDKGYYSCLVKNPVEERGEPSHVAELIVHQRWKQVIGILCVIVLVMLKLELGLFWLLAREYQSVFSCLPCNVQSLFNIDQCTSSNTSDRVQSSFKLDGPPTLHTLRHYPVTSGYVDIAVEITDYEKFGILLLEDKKGNIVDSIAKSKHYVPVDITVEILKHWLQGEGRKPVMWQTLVKCLRDMKMHVLADNIESSLSERNGNKDSDRASFKEL